MKSDPSTWFVLARHKAREGAFRRLGCQRGRGPSQREGGASHTKGCKIDDGENKAIESAKSRWKKKMMMKKKLLSREAR